MANLTISNDQKLYIKFDKNGTLTSVTSPNTVKKVSWINGVKYEENVPFSYIPRASVGSNGSINTWFDVVDQVYQYEAESYITILNSLSDEATELTSQVAGSIDTTAEVGISWGRFTINEQWTQHSAGNVAGYFLMEFYALQANNTTEAINKEGYVHIKFVDKYNSGYGNADYYFGIVLTQYGTTSAHENDDYLYWYAKNSTTWETDPLDHPLSIPTISVSASGASNFYYISVQKQDNHSSGVPVAMSPSVVSDSGSWLSWTIIEGNDYDYTIKFSAAQNDTAFGNEANVTISDGNTTLFILNITQAAGSQGGADPHGGGTGEDGSTTPPDYWANGDIFTAVDDNLGEVADPSLLLFKGGSANIYKTIEAKDNTLFLGNYEEGVNLYNLKNLINDTAGIGGAGQPQDASSWISQNWIKVTNFCKSSSSSLYPYVPNMELSSKDKRVFKKGEKYLFGLVFTLASGQKTDVYYVGEFTPTNDSYLMSSGTDLHKYIGIVQIPAAVTEVLYRNGVRAVFPVCAQTSKHSVIAQGILSSTINMPSRTTAENIDRQYAWFYPHSMTTAADAAYTERGFSDIQSNLSYTRDRQIVTLNTPETEASTFIQNSDLSNCSLRKVRTFATSGATFFANISLNVSNKYLHSELRKPTMTRIDGKVRAWYGFLDPGFWDEESDNAFTTATGNTSYYSTFDVWPWNRTIIGGEGPTNKIVNKIFLQTAYYPDDYTNPNLSASNISITDAFIYRDYDATSLARLDSTIYQGNVDYLITPSTSYYAYANSITIDGNSYQWPRAWQDAADGWTYAGYNKGGGILDPIKMRYKSAPHIAMKLTSAYPAESADSCVLAEIVSNTSTTYTEGDRVANPWIKCGDAVRVLGSNVARVLYEEGDYFYGRFDSLRTYPYTSEETNAVTDIVSCMLHSRVNLDARVDRNRGVNYPRVTPTNFNIFNEVYNQTNNFFTFTYLATDNTNVNRKFVNSIQWSLPKVYGADIDNWSNIQDANTMDLDGNLGELTILKRLDNNLFSFQKAGIAQVLYNESTQIASTEGVPIELGNSGKVNGKRYLTNAIGCQNPLALTQSPSGLYFVDGINKTFYILGSNGALVDLCSTQGMKSWALQNLDESWWCYYDLFSQEVLITSSNSALAYSDIWKKFQCFLSYKDVKYAPSFGGRVYPIQPYNNNVTLWLKNSVQSPTIFGVTYPVEIELHVNPEPIEDKTFTDLEYRADGFNSYSKHEEFEYNANATFDSIRVSDEYQDTGEVSLNRYSAKPSILKKKFRIWRIQIPRDSTNRMDRIRNPWCHVKLKANMASMQKFVVHDFRMYYTK